MQEREYREGDTVLAYRRESGEITVTGCRGRAWRVQVPGRIDELPVTALDKKCFLSCKDLREILLPEGICRIGDWAFAYCTSLERVVMPGRPVTLGRSLFLECGSLQSIETGTDPETGYGRLLAAAVTGMEAPYLMEPGAVGGEEWLYKWDARLRAVMEEDDREGYSKQVLCGEEDYGSTDLEAFLSGRRRKKVRLAMLRLLWDGGLQEPFREYLRAYLKNHTKGCAGEEAWLVLWQEYPEDHRRRQLFLDCGCAQAGNLEDMLADVGEDHPELKAALLRCRQGTDPGGDFFSQLSL